MQPGAASGVQTRDEARAAAEASRGLRRHPQRSVQQVIQEPEEGSETHRQEMVLYPLAGIGTWIWDWAWESKPGRWQAETDASKASKADSKMLQSMPEEQ